MSRNLAVFGYNPDGELYLGIDFGYRNPFACLWIQPIEGGERVLVLDEYYQRYRTTLENGKAILAHHQASGYGPLTYAFADPSDPDKRAMLSEILGIEVKAPRRPVEVGQELVRQWLRVRPEDGLPGLLIHHRCKNLIRELKGYMVHEPGKGEHHALDALRYFFGGWERT
uniref:Terminase large subunit gp17-like C-terminal domain-containing protein n=1 Tax=Desulfobacca acetoxidans TaxID=60893 RepID=A0A7C3SIK2_9BACT